MTHPSDKELDEYLRRESTVSERYRALDADDVPPALDAAVMAQARAAVAPKKKAMPAWVRWGSPLALAASAVLVVAIVLEVGVQDELHVPAPQLKREVGAAAVDTEKADSPSAAAPAAERDVVERPLRAVAPPPPPQPVAAPQSQPAPVPSLARARQSANVEQQQESRREAEEVVVSGTNIKSVHEDAAIAMTALESAPELKSNDQTRPAFGPRAPGAPRAINADARADAEPQIYLTPASWLDAIRKLRADGKTTEADEQWRAFRRMYPDFEVRAGDTALPAPSR